MRPRTAPAPRRPSSRRVHLLAALALAIVGLLLATRPGESAARFSRAEWIEAHELENRFDGGALPARTPAPRPKRTIAE